MLAIFQQIKIAKVIPVYYAEPTTQPGNYRPISLLPSLSKIFERPNLSRLISFFLTQKNINSNSIWFSTYYLMYPSLNILTECYDNIQHKHFSTLLFLDIKKAFDSVCHKKLLKKLSYYGIRDVSNTFIYSYLRNRKQIVCNNDHFSSFKSFEFGVPQGSISKPLCFWFISIICLCLLTRFYQLADSFEWLNPSSFKNSSFKYCSICYQI